MFSVSHLKTICSTLQLKFNIYSGGVRIWVKGGKIKRIRFETKLIEKWLKKKQLYNNVN